MAKNVRKTSFTYFFILLDNNSVKKPFKGGDGLAAVKIPGGELPWEIDIDFIFHPDVRNMSLIINFKPF